MIHSRRGFGICKKFGHEKKDLERPKNLEVIPSLGDGTHLVVK
jgi:hypothetical protein